MKNSQKNGGTPIWQVVLFWLYVSLPLAWGISQTFKKAMALFS